MESFSKEEARRCTALPASREAAKAGSGEARAGVNSRCEPFGFATTRRLVTDAEGGGGVGGYFLLECGSMAEAIEYAAKIPEPRRRGRGPDLLRRSETGGADHEVREIIYGDDAAWVDLSDEEKATAHRNAKWMRSRRAAEGRSEPDATSSTNATREVGRVRMGKDRTADRSPRPRGRRRDLRRRAADRERRSGALRYPQRARLAEIRPIGRVTVERSSRGGGHCRRHPHRFLGDPNSPRTVQDAFATALERWPRTACTTNQAPGSYD